MQDNNLTRLKLKIIALLLAIITWFYVHSVLLR